MNTNIMEGVTSNVWKPEEIARIKELELNMEDPNIKITSVEFDELVRLLGKDPIKLGIFQRENESFLKGMTWMKKAERNDGANNIK